MSQRSLWFSPSVGWAFSNYLRMSGNSPTGADSTSLRHVVQIIGTLDEFC
jgi:hypothetical protein